MVIGSTSTAGDSYLIAETVSRHLAKALGANMKVDAVGAAVALDAMQTSRPDGKTIMMFHDMTYLGVSFKAYDDIYKLENMEIGPRVAQNPGAAWAAYLDAPYNTMAEIPEYLKANPEAKVRMACEAGGVSTSASSLSGSGSRASTAGRRGQDRRDRGRLHLRQDSASSTGTRT